MVLLASALLLHLFVPGLAADGRAAVETAVALETGVSGGASSAEAAGIGDPCPFEEDTSVRRLLARSPRTAGTAGAPHVTACAPVRASLVDRGGTDIRVVEAAKRPGAGDRSRSAAELQTFRC